MAKYKIRNLNVFETKKFLSKHSAENGKLNSSQNDYSFINNLKNVKANTTLTIYIR